MKKVFFLLSVLVSLILSSPVHAAVAFDTSAASNGLSVVFAPSASANEIILTSATISNPGTVTATWNGNAMTRIVTNQNDGTATWLNVFSIQNSDTGSHTATVSAGGSSNAVSVMSFTGVGTVGTPVSSNAGPTGATSISNSATITSSGMVVGAFAGADPAASITLGQSNGVKAGDINITSGMNTNTGNGSVAVSANDSNHPNWSAAAIPLSAPATPTFSLWQFFGW